MQNQQPTVRLAVANTAIITGGVAGENYRVHRREFVVAAAAATILSKSVFRRRWHGESVLWNEDGSEDEGEKQSMLLAS